jgi:hypothetical protein
MTFEEFVAFLEPDKIRGGAICQPLSDFMAQKTAIEQACVLLGNRCSKEMKEKLQIISKEISSFLIATKGKIK